MTICHLLECIYNDRENDPHCTLSEIEIDTKKQCTNFKTDFIYLTEQFRDRRPALAPRGAHRLRALVAPCPFLSPHNCFPTSIVPVGAIFGSLTQGGIIR